MKKLRIFLACADERLRIALFLLLDDEPGMVVVGITDRLPGLLPQLEASQTDVVLLDWDLPFQSMADLLKDIKNLESPPEVIYLSNRLEDKTMMLAAGADHFITKNSPPDELLPALKTHQYQ